MIDRRVLGVAAVAAAVLATAITAAQTPVTAQPAQPASVTIAGSLQSELGCPADWNPACATTGLAVDAEDGVWRSTFTVPLGAYEYKAALNGTWDENYGARGVPNGPNIALAVPADRPVRFYYSHDSHWVTDNVNDRIATAAGDFQSELGCPADWLPDCLRSWLQDVDDDGIATFVTTALPAGPYEWKVALNEAWDENYGAGGIAGGANIAFAVPAGGDRVTFSWDSATNVPTVEVVSGSGLEDGDELLVTEPVRTPASDEVVYFVMTDRFADGQPSNNRAGSSSNDRLVHGYDPTGKGWYHGGDLAGLLDHLTYLDELGVTALWITPPFTNRWVQGDLTPGGTSAGYHGYWQVDYTQIDPHLGTNEQMRDLVDAAHGRGMKVYFDVVLNHTGDVVSYEEGGTFTYRNKTNAPYRDAAGVPFDDRDFAGTDTFPELDVEESFPYTPTFLTPADASVKNPAWLNDPTLYHNRGNSTFVGENSLYGDFFGLDDLFTEHPDVVEGMIDIHTSMIEQFDIDGFRVDTVKHVNDELWEQFVPAVREAGGDDFAVFGEVFDSNPDYLSRFSTELPFPSTLDFRFNGTVGGVVSSPAPTDGLRNMFADDDWFTDADSNALILTKFVGNHDVGRIGATIQRAGTPPDQWLPRAQLAQVLNFTTRGTPVVYYGDEQGFTGSGGDQDARQDMFPSQVAEYNDDDLIGTDATTADDNFDQDHPLYTTIADLAALRQDHVALRQGAQLHRASEAGAGIYAFSRIERVEQVEYVVATNNSTAVDTVTFTTDSPGTEFTPLYGATAPVTTSGSGAMTLTVPALSAVVYVAGQPIPLDDAYEAIAITTPTGGAEVTGRVPVRAQVGGGRFAEVTFVAAVGDGDFEVIGVDDNAPYAVYHDVSGLAAGTPVEYRAIVRDANGNLNAAGTTAEVGETEEPPGPGTPVDAKYAVVHYQRGDATYAGWTLDASGDLTGDGTAEPAFIGEDDYGRFAWVELDPGANAVEFVVRNGAQADPDANPRMFDPSQTPEIWLKSGDPTIYTSQAAAQGFAIVHYRRPDGNYTGWGLHLWGEALAPGIGTDWASPRPFDGVDAFGAFWRVPLNVTAVDDGAPMNFIIHQGDTKDPGPDQSIVPGTQPAAWIMSGDTTIHRTRGSAQDFATIHYHRPDGDYGNQSSSDYRDFWGLHVWSGAAAPTEWPAPIKAVRQDAFGLVFEVPLVADAASLSHIIHRGDAKDPNADMSLDLVKYGYEVWRQTLPPATPTAEWILPIIGARGPAGDLGEQRAHWVSADTIVWPGADDARLGYRLHHDPDGKMTLSTSGIGGESIRLRPTTLDPAIAAKFPHLADEPALRIPAAQVERARGWLSGQVAVTATDFGRGLADATGLQIPGVLDDHYANDDELGVTWDGDVPTLRVWAPTAKSVALQLFADSDPTSTATTLPMTRDPATGGWTVTGDATWAGRYYRYDVEVYAPSVDAVVRNLVTDPYSLSLSINSARSQIVDLSDPALAPAGWDDVEKPELDAPEDLSIYELHVRDFSISDETVPADVQGTFGAFSVEDSDGMEHLGALADAGLGAVHLLPVFDIATIEEDPSARREPDQAALAAAGPDSEVQQQLVNATRTFDGFNWGYDPWHYTVPEGSYSTDPDGPRRINEFREMVGALNGTGLRVIMDVVYNHTTTAGQDPKSVLDRIVPGYYHRLLEDGAIARSTCCENTASEHEMMEKLLIDSVVTWARDYKVDGFRFDLMGHHSKANMLNLRDALDELTLEEDGVDGSSIYLYGEGWNFGEVANNARFEQATQLNMAGTGIGTFNDRLRDAVRGGGPFDGGNSLVLNQGVINGLWYDPNEAVGAPTQAQRDRLLLSADQIRVGLAGNLADYTFVDRRGVTVKGSDVDYNGSPAGYNDDPQEHIVYVAAHDNQTLWDIGQYHHPLATSTADRVRAQNLGMDFTVLAQGVPFVHAGEDLLRTKQMDRNSYDSGDWFNRVDFSGTTNHWGGGVPPSPENTDNWPLIKPRLAGLPAPSADDIARSAAHLREMLEVRESSPLFRLGTAAEVQQRLRFHNTGPAQQPGLVVMTLDDPVAAPLATGDLDPAVDRLAVLFNPTDSPATYAIESWRGEPSVALHPVLASSVDDVVGESTFDAATGTFTVPARTTAVFVDDPDDTPPTLSAELRRVSGTPRMGGYLVLLACADPGGGPVELVADVNGVPVEHTDVLLLIVNATPAGPVRIGNLTLIWGPSFTLTATCTDAAGNTTTRRSPATQAGG